MISRRGLRRAGGTSITKCCGREAITQADADEVSKNLHPETDDRTLIIEENFPEADLVCPGCSRTWPDDGCQHDEYTVVTPTPYEIEDEQNSVWVRGVCDDCDERLNVLLEVGDVREVESSRRVSSASRDPEDRDEVENND